MHWDYYVVRVLHPVDRQLKSAQEGGGGGALVKRPPRINQGWGLSCRNECQRACPHSHVDVISVHDAAQVFIGGKDSVETVVIDVSYNHLTKEMRGLLNTYENWASLFLSM